MLTGTPGHTGPSDDIAAHSLPLPRFVASRALAGCRPAVSCAGASLVAIESLGLTDEFVPVRIRGVLHTAELALLTPSYAAQVEGATHALGHERTNAEGRGDPALLKVGALCLSLSDEVELVPLRLGDEAGEAVDGK